MSMINLWLNFLNQQQIGSVYAHRSRFRKIRSLWLQTLCFVYISIGAMYSSLGGCKIFDWGNGNILYFALKVAVVARLNDKLWH